MIKIGEGFFSKKQKKASRLYQKIKRGFSAASPGGLDFSMPSEGLMAGLLSLLFTRKIGRYRS